MGWDNYGFQEGYLMVLLRVYLLKYGGVRIISGIRKDEFVEGQIGYDGVREGSSGQGWIGKR